MLHAFDPATEATVTAVPPETISQIIDALETMMRISYVTSDLDISSDYLIEPAHIDSAILAAIDASLLISRGADHFAARHEPALARSHSRRSRGRRSGRRARV